MGEVLHEVDFQQLKIENSQYLEKIDERNQDLLRLKLMAGNTLQVLNSYKVCTIDVFSLQQTLWCNDLAVFRIVGRCFVCRLLRLFLS